MLALIVPASASFSVSFCATSSLKPPRLTGELCFPDGLLGFNSDSHPSGTTSIYSSFNEEFLKGREGSFHLCLLSSRHQLGPEPTPSKPWLIDPFMPWQRRLTILLKWYLQ